MVAPPDEQKVVADADTQAYRDFLEAHQLRDVSREAVAGTLPPAFEMTQDVRALRAMLEAGKCPVVAGIHGVGRSALIQELVRRHVAGEAVQALAGKRVVTFSLRRLVAASRGAEALRVLWDRLVTALVEVGHDRVPWFTDVHGAYGVDPGPLLHALALRFPNPILVEADPARVRDLFQRTPELADFFAVLHLQAPAAETSTRILEQWRATQRTDDGGPAFLPEAVYQALDLAHRFLAPTPEHHGAMTLLKQAKQMGRRGEPVDARAVVDRFCATHPVPRLLADPAEPLDVDEMERSLGQAVLGQTEAVRSVVRAIARIKTGLLPRHRPLATLLFVGPRGVGKTHLIETLAVYLFGPRAPILHLHMGAFTHQDTVDLLFGGPHTSSQLGPGLLASRVREQPVALMVLDAFDQAHPTVRHRFLDLFEKGVFVDGGGEPVSCRGMIIIATTNTGAAAWHAAVPGFLAVPPDPTAVQREVDRALLERFGTDGLHRFDQIVHFTPLSREDVKGVARRVLSDLEARLGFRRRGYRLEVEEAVIDWLTAHGYHPEHGVKYLERTAERHAAAALAEAVVRTAAAPGTVFTLAIHRNRVAAEVAGPPRAGPPRDRVVLHLQSSGQSREPDRAHLLAEADVLLRNAARRLEALEARKAEAAHLLDRIRREDLWRREGEGLEVVERYRELDVVIQAGERLAGPLRDLDAARQAVQGNMAGPELLAQALERAARALREWDERTAGDGPDAAWLLFTKVDPLLPCTAWLTDLVTMELAWCRRLGYRARAVACQLHDGDLSRVAIEAEGPGAGAVLKMEHGVHRLVRNQASDLRVRVELVPRTRRAVTRWPALRRVKPREGPFDLRLTVSARVETPDRRIELLGGDEQILGRLVIDLQAYLHEQAPTLETARVYGPQERGVRDPRTGATSPLSETLEGNLDHLLEAWKVRPGKPA